MDTPGRNIIEVVGGPDDGEMVPYGRFTKDPLEAFTAWFISASACDPDHAYVLDVEPGGRCVATYVTKESIGRE